jgi:hypothetical protein
MEFEMHNLRQPVLVALGPQIQALKHPQSRGHFV